MDLGDGAALIRDGAFQLNIRNKIVYSDTAAFLPPSLFLPLLPSLPSSLPLFLVPHFIPSI